MEEKGSTAYGSGSGSGGRDFSGKSPSKDQFVDQVRVIILFLTLQCILL